MRATTIACWMVMGLTGATPSGAQIRASERALVAQDVERLTVDYSRPQARGRELYGTLEPWGRARTPGADRATTLELDEPVTILGIPVPKGRYSVWLRLEEQGPWTSGSK
jgi:hypothetical protein